jgi:hypothetical protein
VAQLLATRPPGHARVIQPYARWFLLQRAHRKNHGGLTSSTTADSIRARITAAVATSPLRHDERRPAITAGTSPVVLYPAG